ncbi:hypothetical protein ACFE04_007002 [Oxalis oulophora]
MIELVTKALSSTTTTHTSSSNCKQLHSIHALIITLGFHQSPFFTGKLITKYSQRKNTITALSVFNQITTKTNVFLWNSIVRALTQNGLHSKALEYYNTMCTINVLPDKYSFPCVINACAGLSDIEMGNVVYKRVLDMGFGSDLYIGNALVDMFSRFGDLEKARKVFDEMSHRDIVSWNTLISGYSANGFWDESLEMFLDLRMNGFLPDKYSLSSVLSACGGLIAVTEGQIIHGLVEKIGVELDVAVSNGLLSMYFKFDRLADAEKLFDMMGFKSFVSWNVAITGFSQLGLYEKSITLFKKMLKSHTADLLNVTSVLRACRNLKDLEFGKFVHDYMIRHGYQHDTTACNFLIDMYAKCGNLSSSRDVFDNMKDKDSVTWNSLINGYFRDGGFDEGIKLFKMMKMDFVPDSVTYLMLLTSSTQSSDLEQGRIFHSEIMKWGFDSELAVGNSLIDMYAKCGSMDDSIMVFKSMEIHDLVTWNTIIAACVHAGNLSMGSEMITKMRKEQVVPDIATMLGILPMCSSLTAQVIGREIHGCIFRLGLENNVPVGNALIEMYAKCGNLNYSIKTFEFMKIKDVITWTALIFSFGMHGDGEKALRAFTKMEASGIIPDHIVFVSIIYACSHSGLVLEGLDFFNRMKKDYKIDPRMEHYACVVDLLSRSGQLTAAEEFIQSMPMEPDASIWGALLSACRESDGIGISERVSEKIMKLESDDSGYHVLVSNVYAGLGKWDQARMIRKFINARGLKKDPGCSWMDSEKGSG